MLRTRGAGVLRQETLHGRGDLFLCVLVEHAAHRTGKSGVHGAHEPIASDKDRRRERVQVVDLRHLLRDVGPLGWFGADEMLESKITPDESLLAIEYVVWRGRFELVKGIPPDR